MNVNIDNLDLLFSFFNQYIYAEAKANIQNIEYYYSTNPRTMANPLVGELINAIKTYDLDAISEPLFRSILMKTRKTEAEAAKIMGEVLKWKGYTKEEMAPARVYLQNIVAASILEKGNKLYEQSPAEYLKYLKNSDYQSSDLSVFKATKFGEIDINSVIADSGQGAISTNLEWLNKAFAPHNGIERGQMGIISAPPGVGKSLLSMDLALWMASHGEKVLYACLGDMGMKDFIVRMGAIAFGVPFAQVYNNLGSVYNSLEQLVHDNLEISINPAGTVSADDIVDLARSKNFTVVIVDYDGNLKGAGDGESMYNTYGAIYNTFTKLTLEGKLVLVCAQPKVYCWNQQITLSDIGESSKKQQAADFIIALSNVNPDCPNHLYTMALPKARRGDVGAKAYVIRIGGRFKELPKGLYDQLRMETEKREYSESEIDVMIGQYQQQYQRIQQNISNPGAPQSQQTAPRRANPFTSARP